MKIMKGIIMQPKLFMVFLLLCGILISCTVYLLADTYEGPVVNENVDLNQYIPFSAGNKLAVLNGESSLKLNENLPRLDGATALYPVYASFAQAVYPARENYRLPYGLVGCTRTDTAFSRLIYGREDIIFTTAPSQEQTAEALENGKKFSLTPIGKEAFVFFVNKSNTINDITTEQIRKIYSGEITNWEQLGGENAEIAAFQRPPNSGSQTTLESIMGGTPIMNAPVNRIPSGMGELIDEVAAYTNLGNAIGYSFLFFATEMVNNDQIKLLSIDGKFPTAQTIRSNEYPFTVMFYAITTGNDTTNMRRLIEWILSNEGQYLIEKTGYTPIR